MRFGSGNTPRKSDPKWNLLWKRLVALQSSLGGNPRNDPHRWDTKRILIDKIEAALSGNVGEER